MACSSTGLSEEQLECSVCLDVFTDPVSTPCGHNFCQTCINSLWDDHQVFFCPLCKKTFDSKLDLCVKSALRDVVHQFKRSRLSGGGQTVEVLCDFCSGRKLKAVKSCLDCLITYCEEHLEPHKRLSQLKRHQLIEPVENLEERVCEKHGRPLEMFCRTDQECVCLMCNVLDHKDHDTVTLETESKDKKVCLDKLVLEVCHTIQRQEEKVKEVQQSADLSNENAAVDIKLCNQVFTGLVQCIEESQAGLQALIEKIKKSTQSKTEDFMKELKHGITDLQKKKNQLEQLSHTEDHLFLLKNFPTLCNPPTMKDWSEVRVDCDPELRTPTKTFTEMRITLDRVMEKLCEIELQMIQRNAVDVTLDPETAHPKLILSEDGKQVRLGGKPQSLPDNPKRFDLVVSVLGREGFSSGRFYYDVQVKDKTMWTLGVARESINRKGEITLSPVNGFWTVWLRDGEYEAIADPSVFLSLSPPPQKVGVFVDYEGGQVSFYDVVNRSHIYSYTGQTFTETLYPYFSPSPKKDGKNSAPLVITPVSHPD